MALEHTGGRPYYYRHVRDGERVLKEYLGAGAFAELCSRSDEVARMERKQRRLEERRELQELEALAAPVVELSEATARWNRIPGFPRRRW